MNVTKNFLFVLLTFAACALIAEPMIFLPLQIPPLTIAQQRHTHERAHEKLSRLLEKKPLHRVAESITRGIIHRPAITNLSGFLAFYNGYMEFSSKQGIISFPIYGHDVITSREVKLLITPQIMLTPEAENTKQEMCIPKDEENAQCFLFKKFRNKQKVYYWKVSSEPLPADRIIDASTVVIISKPQNFYVEQERFFSPKSQHVIFPPNVFVVGYVDQVKDILRSLDIARFFEPVQFLQTIPNDQLIQKIVLP